MLDLLEPIFEFFTDAWGEFVDSKIDKLKGQRKSRLTKVLITLVGILIFIAVLVLLIFISVSIYRALSG